MNALYTICTTIQTALNQEPAPQREDLDASVDSTQLEASIDPAALQRLKDIGFPEQRCIKALLLCNMDVSAATEYLLNQEHNPAADQPLVAPKSVKTAHGKFKPDPAAYHALLEMGFVERDVLAALQLTHNNFDQAVRPARIHGLHLVCSKLLLKDRLW
eukprot:m.510485 g.510485  ORF g.510485 m.510485 type:complete len:159 (-) comp57417_c0_seq6:430-906(-)